MSPRLIAVSVSIMSAVLLLTLAASAPLLAAEQDSARLQQLLYGEALFLSRQQDYLTAITRLQQAEDRQQQSASSIEARLLLARL